MTGPKEFTVRIGDRVYKARVLGVKGKTITVEVDGRTFQVDVGAGEPQVGGIEKTTKASGTPKPPAKPSPPPTSVQSSQAPPSPAPTSGKVIKSSVPGKIVEIVKREGDDVSVNETVLRMESMKMIIEVKSPFAGRVRKVLVGEGEYVNPGTPLVELE